MTRKHIALGAALCGTLLGCQADGSIRTPSPSVPDAPESSPSPGDLTSSERRHERSVLSSDCANVADGRSLGRVDRAELNEISGLVASRRYPETFYVHNDSGDQARFFSLDATAKVRAEYVLAGASAVDWEDIALGPGPDPNADWLYIADTGNNAARLDGAAREHVHVIRVAEPEPLRAQIELTTWEKLVFSYPDKPRDCEAIAVESSTGDLFFVTKENDGRSRLLVARAPHDSRARVLEEIAVLDLSFEPSLSGRSATAMDLSASGSAMIVRTYSAAWLWRRESGSSWANALANGPTCLPVQFEVQGEAIAFWPGARGYLTIGEGLHPELWYFEGPPCP